MEKFTAPNKMCKKKLTVEFHIYLCKQALYKVSATEIIIKYHLKKLCLDLKL